MSTEKLSGSVIEYMQIINMDLKMDGQCQLKIFVKASNANQPPYVNGG